MAITFSRDGLSTQSLPKNYALAQNQPNPFNSLTVIQYQLPVAGRVTLSVYNVAGQRVRTLVSDRQEAGS